MDFIELKTKDGRLVKVDLENAPEQIMVYDSKGTHLGEFCFEPQEDAFDRVYAYRATRTYMEYAGPSWVHQGIGRQVMKYMRDYYGPIIVADNDGQPRDDGSHMTGDAPAFFSKMRGEGIVQPSIEDRADDEDHH